MTFEIQYDTKWGETLFLVNEDTGELLEMTWGDGNVWRTEVRTRPGRYHYEVWRSGRMIRRELGVHTGKSKTPRDCWKEFPIKRAAGVAVPVFSLRSKGDFGIGDFRDLHLLVDWAVKTGQKAIQLLPINDTTRKGEWKDSYPYSPISSFALHPLYLRVDEFLPKEVKPAFKKEQKELNALPLLDYPKVFEAKMRYIRTAFESHQDDLKSREYKQFCKDNAFWLDDYALFCATRDGNEQNFHKWIQFQLDSQLSQEVSYARNKGVFFKGDLPIGVSGDSVEAKVSPEMFNLDCSAGAPPDFFSADGQNWGFPTYNWEAMEEDDYAWWKARLRKMNEYFDAFRIDHVLGWFRIWEIPCGESGKKGHFNPALPYSTEELQARDLPPDSKLFVEDTRRKGFWHPLISPDTSELNAWQKSTFDALWEDFFFHRHDFFWRENALKKVPSLLGATPMLPCAEDLGMVPSCVNDVMDEYRILSLELPGMEKGRPWPFLSVCTTSTHDMPGLRSSNDDPFFCENAIRGILGSISMLCILPIQDWMSMDESVRKKDASDERINDPANPDNHWCWRLHIPLETLLKEDGFNEKMKLMITASGR